MSACAPSSALRPSRTTAWSSRSRTLIGIESRRNLDQQPRAALGPLDRERAAVRLGALAHRLQTEAARARAEDRLVEAAAVVLDRQAEPAVVALDADVHRRAAAVLGGVGQRLLR